MLHYCRIPWNYIDYVPNIIKWERVIVVGFFLPGEGLFFVFVFVFFVVQFFSKCLGLKFQCSVIQNL